MESLLPSLLCGAFAALAGASGKAAFSPWNSTEWLSSEGLYRLLSFLLMLLSNTLMMRSFVTSIKRLGTGKATVANFTCNYLVSVLFGYFLYGEVASARWAVGALLMIAGVVVISSDLKSKQE